jgi:hypothetical protein
MSRIKQRPESAKRNIAGADAPHVRQRWESHLLFAADAAEIAAVNAAT